MEVRGAKVSFPESFKKMKRAVRDVTVLSGRKNQEENVPPSVASFEAWARFGRNWTETTFSQKVSQSGYD